MRCGWRCRRRCTGLPRILDVGGAVAAEELLNSFDAVVLCCGAKQARDLNVPGRDANGVHFAVEDVYKRQKYDSVSELLKNDPKALKELSRSGSSMPNDPNTGNNTVKMDPSTLYDKDVYKRQEVTSGHWAACHHLDKVK